MAKIKSVFYLERPDLANGSDKDFRKSEVLNLEPKLLNGEIIVKRLGNVKKYSDDTSGFTGDLFCTTFKLSFVTKTASSELDFSAHKFLTDDDIPLANIAAVYQISGDKVKKVTLSSKISRSAKTLRIHTKNFGIYKYELESSTSESDRKNFVTAILHHSCPKKKNFLFGYEFDPEVSSSVSDKTVHGSKRNEWDAWVPSSYTQKSDWDSELTRLGASKSWRVSQINEKFNVSSSMPECVVVPQSTEDKLLKEAAVQFDGFRLPMWCYTHKDGCSLIALSALSPETAHVNRVSGFIDAIMKTETSQGKISTQPKEIDLYKELSISSIVTIENAYSKMAALCAPVTKKDYVETDRVANSLLESTTWLKMVSGCIKLANQISVDLASNHVLIKEDASRDLSCVISSLVQLISDNYCQTLKGFQNLIQRCWVAAGHPFTDRLSLLGDSAITPVFLLFLDCVYQLIVQYPSEYEFSEIYLITLWDSCLSGLFKEFICNCNNERSSDTNYYTDDLPRCNAKYPSASVWNWDNQYDADYISLFKNPLFQYVKHSNSVKQLEHTLEGPLEPIYHLSQMEMWIGCYYRFTPQMQIPDGGRVAEYFQQCLIMEEVTELQNQIAKLKSNSIPRRSGLFFDSNSFNGSLTQKKRSTVDRLKSSLLVSSFPFNNRLTRVISDVEKSLGLLYEKGSLLLLLDDDDSVES